MNFLKNPLHQTRCIPLGTADLKMRLRHQNEPSFPLKNESLIQEIIPRKKSRYGKVASISVFQSLNNIVKYQHRFWFMFILADRQFLI